MAVFFRVFGFKYGLKSHCATQIEIFYFFSLSFKATSSCKSVYHNWHALTPNELKQFQIWSIGINWMYSWVLWRHVSSCLYSFLTLCRGSGLPSDFSAALLKPSLVSSTNLTSLCSRTVWEDFFKATNTTRVCQCTIILFGVNICGALTQRKKKIIFWKSYFRISKYIFLVYLHSFAKFYDFLGEFMYFFATVFIMSMLQTITLGKSGLKKDCFATSINLYKKNSSHKTKMLPAGQPQRQNHF